MDLLWDPGNQHLCLEDHLISVAALDCVSINQTVNAKVVRIWMWNDIYIFLKQHSWYSFLSFWTLLSVLHNDSSWKCMDIVTKKQNKRSWNKRQWHLPSSNEKQRTNLLYNDAHHHVLLSNIDGVGTNSNIYLKLANYNSCT